MSETRGCKAKAVPTPKWVELALCDFVQPTSGLENFFDIYPPNFIWGYSSLSPLGLE